MRLGFLIAPAGLRAALLAAREVTVQHGAVPAPRRWLVPLPPVAGPRLTAHPRPAVRDSAATVGSGPPGRGWRSRRRRGSTGARTVW
ncbi:hypothetical protein [Actinoplanes philippinensis]|uniref:hypothetical protein n=1 Tax=Actinoplanes philippinensis TaxID=35752 RepID=UPI0033D9E069